MRHRKKGKKIGRTSSHRKRTLQALSTALIDNKRITTTVAKAKALRPFVEPLITRAKEDTQHNRRQVFRYLQNKDAIQELFGEVSERVGDRPGGYTRIIRLGQRSGDGAELALVELVDYNDVPPADSGSDRSGKTRRGSGKGRRDASSESEGADKVADTADTTDEADADAPVDEEESSTDEEESSTEDVAEEVGEDTEDDSDSDEPDSDEEKDE